MNSYGYFVIEKEFTEDKKLKQITFIGGGYGHGVGMSQYGAKGMAEQGYNFEQILTHYFAGTVLTEMPVTETTES